MIKTDIEEMSYKSFKKYKITASQFSVDFFSYYLYLMSLSIRFRGGVTKITNC